jgi:hypothetical protein
MKPKPALIECPAEAMARRMPRLFVTMTGILLCGGLLGGLLLGHEVFAKAPWSRHQELDGQTLQRILHRNVVSTSWPKTIPDVQDKY